jgi:hypothetical protein
MFQPVQGISSHAGVNRHSTYAAADNELVDSDGDADEARNFCFLILNPRRRPVPTPCLHALRTSSCHPLKTVMINAADNTTNILVDAAQRACRPLQFN